MSTPIVMCRATAVPFEAHTGPIEDGHYFNTAIIFQPYEFKNGKTITLDSFTVALHQATEGFRATITTSDTTKHNYMLRTVIMGGLIGATAKPESLAWRHLSREENYEWAKANLGECGASHSEYNNRLVVADGAVMIWNDLVDLQCILNAMIGRKPVIWYLKEPHMGAKEASQKVLESYLKEQVVVPLSERVVEAQW